MSNSTKQPEIVLIHLGELTKKLCQKLTEHLHKRGWTTRDVAHLATVLNNGIDPELPIVAVIGSSVAVKSVENLLKLNRPLSRIQSQHVTFVNVDWARKLIQPNTVPKQWHSLAMSNAWDPNKSDQGQHSNTHTTDQGQHSNTHTTDQGQHSNTHTTSNDTTTTTTTGDYCTRSSSFHDGVIATPESLKRSHEELPPRSTPGSQSNISWEGMLADSEDETSDDPMHDSGRLNKYFRPSSQDASSPVELHPRHTRQALFQPSSSLVKTLACQSSPETSKGKLGNENLNSHLTTEFEKLVSYYKSVEKEKWRVYAYQRAIGTLRNLNVRIESVEQAEQLVGKKYGIGKSVFDKIVELLNTGRIAKADQVASNSKTLALTELQKVFGIGYKEATKLYLSGYRNISDLRQRPEVLSKVQTVGLKYFEDFQVPIPRSEVETIVRQVEKVAREVYSNGELLVEGCGSYRRGEPYSGDVDIIITSSAGLPRVMPLILALKQRGLIIDDLVKPRDIGEHRHISDTYMGVYKLPDVQGEQQHVARHIDIKCYPPENFAFALLHFTGSAHFCRSMRWYAKLNGYSLSDYGLRKAIRDSSGVKLAHGESVKCMSEEEIFQVLGLEYRSPTERKCSVGVTSLDPALPKPLMRSLSQPLPKLS